MNACCPPAGFTELGPGGSSKTVEALNVSGGPHHGTRYELASSPGAPAQATGSQLRWALKAMKGSKLVPEGHMAYVGKDSIWEPMEAKAGPLEVMTLPTSPENYSGEGRDQDEDHSIPHDVLEREEGDKETETEGSGRGVNDLPRGFGSNGNSNPASGASSSTKPPVSGLKPTQTQTQSQTVAEHTTISQWQLVDQPTTSPAAAASAAGSSQGPGGTVEEARGEIVYVRRPTEKLLPATSSKKDGFSPVIRKQNLNTTRVTERQRSLDEATTPGVTSRPAAPMEPLTTIKTSTADTQRTDSTREPPISIIWVPVEREKTISTTPLTRDGPQTATASTQLTTPLSILKSSDREAESRLAVSESFVVGKGWKPLGGRNPKSKEDKTLVITEKTEKNPFGVIVPTWGYDLNPSGRFSIVYITINIISLYVIMLYNYKIYSSS